MSAPQNVVGAADRFTAETLVAVTIFKDVFAKAKAEANWLASYMAEQIRTQSAPTKQELRLLKLARFGNRRSRRASFRTDENVVSITGIEVEYDGGEFGFDAVVRLLRGAGLGAILYTSPSHTPDKPRWRILLSCSRSLPPSERRKLVARVNGILDGILSSESFALSQSFYFGFVASNAENHRVELIEGDFIDLRPDLDAGAIDVAPKAPSVDAAPIEAYLKAQVDWDSVYAATSTEQLEVRAPALHERLQEELARKGKLHERWDGGVDGLTDTSRSGRDRSIVQILRTMGFTITEAIACAVARGGDNPTLGRGSEQYDKHGVEIDWERYWVRNWMRPDDRAPIPVEQLAVATSVTPRNGPANPLPEICCNPPGVVGRLVEFFRGASTKVLSEQILVPLAITTLAFATRNRFISGNEKLKTPIQAYTIIIAKTGVGKTEFIKLLMGLLSGWQPDESILEAVASGPALLRRLHKLAPEAPWGPTLLLILDEFGFKLQARQTRSGSTHMKDVMDEVIALFGRSTGAYGGKAYADARNDIKSISRPNLNLIGFSTPVPFHDALTKGDAETGFANRFFLADAADEDAPQKRLDDIDQSIPEDLARYLSGIGNRELKFHPAARAQERPSIPDREAVMRGLGKEDPVLLSFNDDATAYLEELRININAETHGGDALTVSVWTRSLQLVRVVAAILAVGEIDVEHPVLPEITRAHLEWAWAFVCWSNRNWLAVFRGKIASNDEEAAMNELRALLARVSDYAPGGRLSHKADYGNSRNNLAITALGWMPLSLIGRELRSISKDVRAKALAALVENEEVERQETENPDGPKKTTTSYRLATRS